MQVAEVAVALLQEVQVVAVSVVTVDKIMLVYPQVQQTLALAEVVVHLDPTLVVQVLQDS
jgi:hypothetical protein